MSSYDVVVCGGGVAGLTAAHAFRRQGRRVLLVEKQRKPAHVHRGELLQPRSLQILAGLDVLARLHQMGALRAQRLVCRTAGGEEIGALDYSLLAPPYDHCLLHYYQGINAALTDGLRDRVETWQAARADALLRDGSGRVVGARVIRDGVRSDVDAALTVACDGISSRLRADAGIELSRYRYGHELVGFDMTEVELDSDINAHLTRHGLRLLFPMPGGRARLYAQLPAGAYRTMGRAGLPEWAAWLVDSVPALVPVASRLLENVAAAQVLSAWRYNAPTWVRPGLALVGDAAHGVHPMAGQGMNAAIADAWALAQEFADLDALGPADVDAALHRYDTVRRPALDYVGRMSHSLAMLFTDTTWRGQVVGRYMLKRNQHNTRLQHILTYNMSGMGVRRFTARDRLTQFGLLLDPRGRSSTNARPTVGRRIS